MPVATTLTEPITPPPTDSWAALDGRADAPTGTPQQASLLNGYVTRPPWYVAGVDYRVGLQTGVSLTNAASVSQTGVSVDGGGKRLIIDGNNVTLQNVNFPTDWWLSITGTGAIVRNCQFLGASDGNEGSKSWCWPESGGATFEYCYFDLQNGAANYCHRLYNQVAGGGTANTVYRWRYCQLMGAFSDHINVSGWDSALATGDTFDMKYCLLINNAQGPPGTHPDFIQCQNGYVKQMVLNFNTIVLNSVGTGSQGWGMPGSADSANDFGRGQDLSWQYNTAVITASCTFAFSVGDGEVLGACPFSDNYYDITGIAGAELFRIWPDTPRPPGWTPYAGSISGTGNTNMVTGVEDGDWNGTIYSHA